MISDEERSAARALIQAALFSTRPGGVACPAELVALVYAAGELGDGAAANLCEARHVPELSRGLRWLMNTVGAGALLWTAYCAYAWITHSGIWQLVMEVMRPLQKAVPDSQAVAITAWGLGLGAMLVVAWPLSLVLRRR